jgi:hypothetical protein
MQAAGLPDNVARAQLPQTMVIAWRCLDGPWRARDRSSERDDPVAGWRRILE